jgi:hypothetical protein
MESLTCLSGGAARRGTPASTESPNAVMLNHENRRDSKRKSSSNSPREFEMREAKGML